MRKKNCSEQHNGAQKEPHRGWMRQTGTKTHAMRGIFCDCVRLDVEKSVRE